MKNSASQWHASKGARRVEIEERAAEWIARRDAGLSPAESAELDAWLAQDIRHAAVFIELDSMWTDFNRPRIEGRGEALFDGVSKCAARARRHRRLMLSFSAAGLAAVALLVIAFLPGNPQPSRAAESIALHPDRHLLPDGSSVELNAGAEFAMDFTPDKRGVRLVRGEALFEVASDPARPFVVVVGQIEVRAVGTAFSVRHSADEVAVLVTAGQVAVESRDQSPQTAPAGASDGAFIARPEPILLSAGRKVTITLDPAATAPETVQLAPEEVAQSLAWRSRRVEFNATPLTEVVALFNRQPGTQLVLGDEATGALRITGIFWTDDPEGLSRLLVASLGLKAGMDAQRRIVLRE